MKKKKISKTAESLYNFIMQEVESLVNSRILEDVATMYKRDGYRITPELAKSYKPASRGNNLQLANKYSKFEKGSYSPAANKPVGWLARNNAGRHYLYSKFKIVIESYTIDWQLDEKLHVSYLDYTGNVLIHFDSFILELTERYKAKKTVNKYIYVDSKQHDYTLKLVASPGRLCFEPNRITSQQSYRVPEFKYI